MMSTQVRNKIVNSYSLVLEGILKKQSNVMGCINELQDNIKELGDLSNFIVSPIRLNDYKLSIRGIIKNINISDDIVKFLFILLNRRYFFLLSDIVELTKKRLQELNAINVVSVFCFDELNNSLKDNIKNFIYQQLGNDVVIEFKINKHISKDVIEFISNDKICTIDLKHLSKDFFKM